MIIDSHVHLMPKRVRDNRSKHCNSDPAFRSLYCSEKAKLASEQDIIDYLDENEINSAVVFGFPWEDHELVRINNDEIRHFHQKYPDRIIPFAVLSTLAGDPAHKEVERTLKAGFKGIGELAMYHSGWRLADFEALSPSLELAENADVPVVIHVNEPVGHDYPGKIPVDFRGLLRLITAHPDIDFVLAHFGGGIFFYRLMPEIAAATKRTYVDTAASPYLYNALIFEIAVKIMGHDRILFGSDYPLLKLPRYIKQMQAAGLSQDQCRAILGGNAEKLFSKKSTPARVSAI